MAATEHGRGLSRRSLLAAALASAAGGAFANTPARSLLERFGPSAGSAAPRRVFAAGPPAAVLLACLAPEALLGWPMGLSDAARALLPPVLRDKPLLGRLAGRGSTVSLEALLALQPDLIVDAGTVDASYRSGAERVAAQTGLPVLLVDGRLADSAAQLREAGHVLGVAERAERLAAYAEEVLAAVPRAASGTPRPPAVYLARGADGLETATVGAINAEIIEAAGGRNVAHTGRPGVARVSMEQVLDWAPDWVLTQDRSFFARARQEPAWRALTAVREGRLLLAPNLPFGWLDGPPALNRLLGLRWLALQLARGSAADAAAVATSVDEARRFHTLFYGVTPSAEAVRGWLDGQG